MADESILTFKKPSFPQTVKGENSTTTTIEYIGPSAIIDAALPFVGQLWGNYPGSVKSVTDNPTERGGFTDATVTLELTIDSEDAEPGELISISYEIRWVNVERSMFEHPQFAIGEGGANELTTGDIKDIKSWELPENTKEDRELYQYSEEGSQGPLIIELSTNGRLFARGIELGQETWTDKAPVATKISGYVGGPPPETDAGTKQDPVGVLNIPIGYEWRKETADSTRAGGEIRWNLTEEWLGAKKVLVDKNQIYWAAPL